MIANLYSTLTRSSQVELATSVATSSEALPHVGSTGQLTGSGGHLRGSGGQLSSGPGGRLAATVSAPHIPEYDDRLSGQHAAAQRSATELSHQPGTYLLATWRVITKSVITGDVSGSFIGNQSVS